MSTSDRGTFPTSGLQLERRETVDRGEMSLVLRDTVMSGVRDCDPGEIIEDLGIEVEC